MVSIRIHTPNHSDITYSKCVRLHLYVSSRRENNMKTLMAWSANIRQHIQTLEKSPAPLNCAMHGMCTWGWHLMRWFPNWLSVSQFPSRVNWLMVVDKMTGHLRVLHVGISHWGMLQQLVGFFQISYLGGHLVGTWLWHSHSEADIQWTTETMDHRHLPLGCALKIHPSILPLGLL